MSINQGRNRNRPSDSLRKSLGRRFISIPNSKILDPEISKSVKTPILHCPKSCCLYRILSLLNIVSSPMVISKHTLHRLIKAQLEIITKTELLSFLIYPDLKTALNGKKLHILESLMDMEALTVLTS